MAPVVEKLRLRVEIFPSTAGSTSTRHLVPIGRTNTISDLCALLHTRFSLNPTDVTLTLQDGTLIFPGDQLVDVVGNNAEDVIYVKAAGEKSISPTPVGPAAQLEAAISRASAATTTLAAPRPASLSFDSGYSSSPPIDPSKGTFGISRPALVSPPSFDTASTPGPSLDSAESGAWGSGGGADSWGGPDSKDAPGALPNAEKSRDDWTRLRGDRDARRGLGGGSGAWESMHNPANQNGRGAGNTVPFSGSTTTEDKGPRGGFKVFIGAMSYNTTDEGLHGCFSQYGAVTDSVVMVDRETGRPRGFGFVTYANESEAEAAIAGMDGQYLDGRSVHVKMANSVQPRGGNHGGGSGRGYGGGGDGGGYRGGCSGGYGGYGGDVGANDAGGGDTGLYW